MSLHFTAKQAFEDGAIRLNWCKMCFKPDFKEMLSMYGTIPKQRCESVVQLMACHKEDKRLLDEKEHALQKHTSTIKELKTELE